jgi:hypothetical protein
MKQKNTTMKKKIFKRRRRKVDHDDDDLFEENEILEEEEHSEDEFTCKDDYFTKYNDTEEEKEEEEEVKSEEEKKTIKPQKEKVDKTKFYVDPKEFDNEIVSFYKTSIMSDNLALMVSKISNKLSFAPNFINYSYREEMVGDGIVRMMKALISKKYNRKKGTNPFSYFTRIAFNAFRNRIKKEKHIHETHEKYQKEFMLMSESFNHLFKNNNIKIMKERDRE